MGRTPTQRHYNSANFPSGAEAFPRSKNIPAPRSFPLAFLSKAGDQGSLAHQPQCRVAAGRGRKVETTQFTRGTAAWSFDKAGCKHLAVASRKRIRFTFLDQAGGLLASFTGVDFRTSIRSALALHGETNMARISLRDRFFLEQLRSSLRYEPDVLELSKISARAANGEINGYFAMQPEAEDSPFTTSVKFRNVLADQIVENAGGPKGMVKGKLEGSFQASGKTADPNALVGRGEIFLRDGRVQQYSLLVLLGQILQIEELQELHLEQAEAKYHLSPGLVTIDELILRSPNIRLTASGTVAFDGRLKLDSQLAINDRIRGQLFKAIRANFQPINEPGYSAIDFHVGGTIDRPSTNLMDRLVGRDLSGMLNSLLGGKRDRSKKKKKQTEEAVPAVPSPSASPEEAPPQATATPTPVVSP